MALPPRQPASSGCENTYAKYQKRLRDEEERSRERDILNNRGWITHPPGPTRPTATTDHELPSTPGNWIEPPMMPEQSKYLEFQRKHSAEFFADYEVRQARKQRERKANQQAEDEWRKEEWSNRIRVKQEKENNEMEEEHANEIANWERAQEEKKEQRKQKRRERRAMFRGEDEVSSSSSPDDQERFREMLEDFPKVPTGMSFKYCK